MPNGTVRWSNATRGFGRIQPEHCSKDVFVHITAVERAGIPGIEDGQAVTFDIGTGQDGLCSASNLARA